MKQIGEIIFHIIALLFVTPIVALTILNIQWIIIGMLSVISMFMTVDVIKRYAGVS